MSTPVAQAALLSLRNLLDDVTAWGWAQAPPRRWGRPALKLDHRHTRLR